MEILFHPWYQSSLVIFSSELVRPKIDIAHKPQMIEAQDRGPLILNIGDNATALTKTAIVVLCHASGVPTPTVTWTKDGQILSHDEGSSKIVNNDGSLRIVYSTEFDSGEYRCTATNIVGEEAMKSTVRIVGELFFNKRSILCTVMA